jgi:hypothetical protein
MKNFKQKLRKKIKIEHDEGADYRFWARFKKEGAKSPLIYRTWAPVFMILLCAFIGVSIYHSPEKNQQILTFKVATPTSEIESFLELDRESEEMFADVGASLESQERADAYLFL